MMIIIMIDDVFSPLSSHRHNCFTQTFKLVIQESDELAEFINNVAQRFDVSIHVSMCQ